MKNCIGSVFCFLIIVLAGNAQPADPEEMVLEVKTESYVVTGGEDTRYMAAIGRKGFMIWDSQENVISRGSWATDCFACKAQVLNDHLIMLKNDTKEKKVYAHIYGIDGKYLGRKDLTENKQSYYFPYAQTSLNGRFALYEAQKNKNGFFEPRGYIGLNANAQLLWSIDIKSFEKEYGAPIKSYQIDNEGNGIFLLVKDEKENHVFTMIRIPAGGGSPQQKIIKIARQNTEVNGFGLTMHPDGRVLMYANYYNRMYNQQLKHGFVYGVVDFGAQDTPSLKQVQRNWTRKLEYMPNHLQGFFAGDDFYFANEVMFKVVGPGNDDVFFILNKVDGNGNILHELKIPCAISFVSSSCSSYMAEVNNGNLVVAYVRKGEKGETTFVSEYKMLDETFKELKSAVIEQRVGVTADLYNHQIRVIDKYALIGVPRLDYIWLLLDTEK
ncbi:MAG: hypothetical protein IBJ09_07930 [Bacteroidia bacterium]|nr:hypothetical protein [Bacteroidia bacterium]